MARKEATPKLNAQGDLEVDVKRPLLVYLRGILASLKPTERLIAECVLKDPERTITSSIGEIRKASGASVGSIVGFCQLLGMKGFADFKIALARDLAQAGLSGGNAQQNGSLFERVFDFHARSLTETLQINSPATFESAASAIQNARRIELFSIGISYPVAYTAYCKFQLLGLAASAQFDSHIQLIAATQLKAGDVAIAVSCSGTTRETVHCLKVAKAQNASTICLTNAMNSPITEFADIRLYATPSEIKYFQAPLASRVTQLAVIDALFVSLALKNKNRTATRLQKSSEALVRHAFT
jgi:DNA-binding MurR/RpiR family transcriptional regulator